MTMRPPPDAVVAELAAAVGEAAAADEVLAAAGADAALALAADDVDDAAFFELLQPASVSVTQPTAATICHLARLRDEVIIRNFLPRY